MLGEFACGKVLKVVWNVATVNYLSCKLQAASEMKGNIVISETGYISLCLS